jgi:hypothetical protein
MSDFVIRPFAFMRLTHEALRAGFSAIQVAAAAGDLAAAADANTALSRVIELHKRHEEEVFFAMLDEHFDGVVTKAGLRETHEREHALQEAVNAALDAGDLQALNSAIDQWAPAFEAHLAEEEEVMMPLTELIAPTLEGRAAAVHEIMAVDWAQLAQVHLPYVVRSLSMTKPYGPLRMFVAAVQIAAGDRFGTLEPVIRDALPAEKVAMLTEHGHLSAEVTASQI